MTKLTKVLKTIITIIFMIGSSVAFPVSLLYFAWSGYTIFADRGFPSAVGYVITRGFISFAICMILYAIGMRVGKSIKSIRKVRRTV